MPVRWKIENAILILSLDGAYEFSEVTTAVHLAFSDPRFHPGTALLLDERTSIVNPSAAEKRARVSWIASLRPSIGLRIALVTSAEPLRYGLARMASVYFENTGMQAAVFIDIKLAEQWLAE